VSRFSCLLVLVTLVASACAEEGSRPWFRPPVRAPFTVVATYPEDGAQEVLRDAPLDIFFSEMPDPDSLGRAVFTLRSGNVHFTGGFTVDLMERRVRYIPARALPPHLEMHAVLLGTIRALDGRELGQDIEWHFVTGDQLSEPQPAPAPVTLSEIGPVLAAQCASCHAGSWAYRGLDLSSPEVAYQSLVAKRSAERPELFLVAPSDNSRSYLVRKLLAAPRIVGDPMPPEAPLDAEALRRIVRWVDDGALP